jgi:hypothetical protein
MFQWSLITKHVEVTLSTASSLLLECTATFFNFIFPWEYSSICSHALQEMLAESSVILQNLFSALYLVSCWSACLAWNEKSLLIKVSLPLGIMVERDDSSRMCFIDPALEFQVTWLLLASIFWGNNWCRFQTLPRFLCCISFEALLIYLDADQVPTLPLKVRGLLKDVKGSQLPKQPNEC